MPRQRTPALLIGTLLLLPGDARPESPASGTVVLDLVVRDKKGAAIADLAETEVEVYEEGAKQAVAGFRRVTEGSHPVALVFPDLSPEENVLAQAAAEDLIRKQLTGLTVAVYNIGSELVLVQDFTTDASLLKTAVKRALDTRAKAGYPEVQVLFSLVDKLKELPGRKVAVIFSAGLALPVGAEDIVGTLAGVANRNRISFYGIDPRGVAVAGAGTKLAQESAGVTTEVWLRGGASVSGEDLRGYGVNVGKDSPVSSPTALAKLTTSTGGFAAERTNNLSRPIREIAEDARAFYELAYTPAAPGPAGGLRKTEVKVAREGTKVQAPQGYLVGDIATSVRPYEKRLAEALATEPLAADVEVWDRLLRFAWDGTEMTHVLWVAVPLAKVALASDTQAGTFKGDVSVLARVKDTSGKVVATFSRPYPLAGPLDQVTRAQSQSIPFVRRLKLAPGEYTLETAVRDEGAGKVTARRTSFKAKAPEGIAMSSLSLGSLVPASEADPEDPLRIGSQRLVPNVGQPIKAGQPSMTLYSVVYPVAGSKDPAEMTITVLLGDEVANTATTKLPAPDAKGRIPYTTALRMDVLPPGPYRIKVGVAQGATKAEESLAFTIVP
jgi:VWFA-related protein